MRIDTPPKAFIALWITAAPSVTEEVFAMALPPAKSNTTSHLRAGTSECTSAPFFISSTTFCAASALKSFTTTFAPRDANSNEYLPHSF